MKRFLLIFTGAATPFGQLSPEEANSIKSQWSQWTQGLGDALLDEGAPLGNGLEVIKGEDEHGRTLPIHGYAVIQAEDVNRAAGLAQSHPYLQSNEPAGDFGINVLEISPEPGSYQPHPTEAVEYTDNAETLQQPAAQPAAYQQADPAGTDQQYSTQGSPDGELDIAHEDQPQPNPQDNYDNQLGQVYGPGQQQPPPPPAPSQNQYGQPQPNPGPLPPSQQGPPPPLPPQQQGTGNPSLNKPEDPLVM